MQIDKRTVDTVAGAFSGFTARLITAPLDVIKIRFQLQSYSKKAYNSISDSVLKIFQREGVLAFWKGNLSATCLWTSYSAVQFTIYGQLKSSYRPKTSLESVVLSFISGAVSGMAATIATYPFDLMRTQFAMQGRVKFYNTYWAFVKSTLENTTGIRGLYSGLTPTVLAIVPQMGINFLVFELLLSGVSGQTTLPNSQHSTEQPTALWKVGACGSAAGVISKLFVYPMDTIKKRLQAQIVHSSLSDSFITGTHLYSGWLDCARRILSIEGPAGLYKGITPTVLKSATAVGITFVSFEGCRRILLKEY